MSAYTEDHLIDQPAIQLMEHELGWDVERGMILNVGSVVAVGFAGTSFWILNEKGRRKSAAEPGFADVVASNNH